MELCLYMPTRFVFTQKQFISTSEWRAEQPFTGRNTQHTTILKHEKNLMLIFKVM